MRKVFLFLVSFCLYFFSFNKPAWAVIDGHLTIASPSGGQTFHVGDTCTISWDASSNIDKVSIGYKSCPSCLDWIAFSHPTSGSGSYTWTVNVGNTTNTQFIIDITGYETGKGSLSAQSGTFTVLGAGGSPASPNPIPSPSPINTNTGINSTAYPSPLPQTEIDRLKNLGRQNQEKYSPVPVDQEIKPAVLTLQSITFSETFYFEGSLTTDLSQIKDPSQVENFTLDTKYNWTVVFTETVDLTDPQKLQALQNLDELWVVEWWFIWIKIEWWEVFEIPCEVSFKNDYLTSFTPILTLSQPEDVKQDQEVKEAKIEIKETKPGEVKAVVDGSGKIEIKPQVKFLDNQKTVSGEKAILKAKSSHQNLKYQLKVNGQEQATEFKDFNSETGEFNFVVKDLIKGANFIQLYFREEGKDWQLGDEKSFFRQNNWQQYTLIASLLILLITAIFLEKKFHFIPQLLKKLKKNKKK